MRSSKQKKKFGTTFFNAAIDIPILIIVLAIILFVLLAPKVGTLLDFDVGEIPGEPVPPSDDVLAEYLSSMISAGRIDGEMYISQAYLLTDSETDSYCNFWYFVFENDEIRAVLNLALTPDDEGHYANANHLIDGEEIITACFKRILEENQSFGIVSTGGEYPLTILCAEDGSETVLYPVNERGNIDIEDTDEMFSLHCFETKNLELRKVSDILNH